MRPMDNRRLSEGTDRGRGMADMQKFVGSAGRKRGRERSALITLCVKGIFILLASAAAAAVAVPPSDPAYYDMLRTSPEEMGVLGTRTDPSVGQEGQSTVVEFSLQTDIQGEQGTFYLADITALLPYTIQYMAGGRGAGVGGGQPPILQQGGSNTGALDDDATNRPGVHDDAAALLLAIHHFNNHLTPAITGPTLPPAIVDGYADCPVKLTTDIHDTGYSPIQSTRLLTDVLDRPHTAQTAPLRPLPAAVLGAFRSASTTPTAILSGVNGLPQLSYRSSSTDFDNKEQYPYFGRTVPSSSSDARAVIAYLQHLNVEYVGVIFVTDAFGASYQKSLQDAAGDAVPPIRTDSVSFGYRMDVDPSDADVGTDKDEIRNAVASLAATRYRYFVALIGEEHYDRVMREAAEQGLTGPDFVWIFVEGVDRTVWQEIAKYDEDDVLANSSNGIALIQVEGAQATDALSAETGLMNKVNESVSYEDTSHDRFRQAWSEAMSDPVMVEYFRSKQPKAMDDLDYEFSPEPSQFSYFIWDAIQSLGFAMCMTERATGPFFVGSDVHANFVANVTFEGASGDFGIVSTTGTRDVVGVTYTVWNARAASTDRAGVVGFDLHPTSHIIPVPQGNPEESSPSVGQPFKIEEVGSFLYNDGTDRQPNPLPPPAVNYNYIGSAGRIVGYVLMGIVVALALAGLIWASIKRMTKAVRASQPIFIAFVSVGCIVMSAAIIPLSMEEPTVNSKAGLDMACMSAPWVYVLGFAVAFAALFTKTYAVYKVFRDPDIDSVTVRPVDIFGTLGVLLLVNVIVLLSWTLVAPLKWERIEGESKDTFDRSTESWATCSPESGSALPFFIVLVAFNLGALVVANFLAYKSRDVATEYQENRYIAISMASILQAWAMGIPIMVVVKDSPQARFFVEVGIIFVTCSAILLLIFIPKMLSERGEVKKQAEDEQRRKRQEFSERHRPNFDEEEDDDERVRRPTTSDASDVGNPQAGVESSPPDAISNTSSHPDSESGALQEVTAQTENITNASDNGGNRSGTGETGPTAT